MAILIHIDRGTQRLELVQDPNRFPVNRDFVKINLETLQVLFDHCKIAVVLFDLAVYDRQR
ncbi:hypothetical protein [Victivallis vadensis]|uniref:hypothetical protein n=1 Tax=Victivallis vadensis TaxID=172901 RepID=UPI003AF55CE6